MNTHVVKTLEHAKLLTDPFKLKLLEHFSGDPVTTKQVADDMGEKAPKLYRHVDAMVEAGFLELVSERPKRGTLERYYRAVASRFEVDPDLFAPGGENSDDAFDMVRSLLRETESDLLKLASLVNEKLPDQIQTPVVFRFSMQADAEKVASLRRKLDDWLAEVQQLADEAKDSANASTDDVNYAGMLAFYPTAETVDAHRQNAKNGDNPDENDDSD